MGADEFREIGDMILATLGGIRSGTMNARTLKSIHEGVSDLTARFPCPTEACSVRRLPTCQGFRSALARRRTAASIS